MSRHVVIYGGSFDPPHLGHVLVINALLNTTGVNEVWLEPTGERDDKQTEASADDRRVMVSLMMTHIFGNQAHVSLDTTQLERRLPSSSTLELLEYMEGMHPDHKFSFAIGADLVRDIPNWKSADKLIQKGSFLVIPRFGMEIPPELPEYAQAVDCPANSDYLSSTRIRKLIKEDKSIIGLVPAAVYRYIQHKGLYR